MFCYLEMTLSFQEQRLMPRCGEYQLVYWMKWLSQWKSGMLTIQNMLALRLLYSSILVCLKIWSMLKHWKITLTNRQEKKRHGRFWANEENSVLSQACNEDNFGLSQREVNITDLLISLYDVLPPSCRQLVCKPGHY